MRLAASALLLPGLLCKQVLPHGHTNPNMHKNDIEEHGGGDRSIAPAMLGSHDLIQYFFGCSPVCLQDDQGRHLSHTGYDTGS